MSTRDKVPLQELDHDWPKCPHLVSDHPEIVMTIQQDVQMLKKPWKSHSRVKNSTSKVAATPLVQNPASPVLPPGVQQETNTALFPGQYQVQPPNLFAPWWAWGPLNLPWYQNWNMWETCHSISSTQDQKPVLRIPWLSSLAATLWQQHNDRHIALQLQILQCQHSKSPHWICLQGHLSHQMLNQTVHPVTNRSHQMQMRS